MASPQAEHDDQIEDLLKRMADAESSAASLAQEVDHLQRLAMVGTLSAGIVHEINNVLTPALVNAQLARLQPDDAAGLARALDGCIHSMTQAGRVAGTLMDFARPRDEGANEQNAPSANVAQALKATIACLGRAPSSGAGSSEAAGGPPSIRGIRIEMRIPPDAWVRIDPLSLQQVFLNLLLNAAKALDGVQAGRIVISARHAEDGSVEIRLADNGPGIPEAIRHTLFQPFTSLPTSTQTEKGTGLGLTVSKRLITMAGGTLDASDNEPKGALFIIRLHSISPAALAKSA